MAANTDTETNAETDLSFGVMVPILGPSASAEGFRRLAATAEDLGYDVLWVGEHVVFPSEISSDYPFTDSGEPPGMSADQNLFGAIETLAYLAGETSDIRIGTNVCLPPLRHPAMLTKQVFTLDALSGGRFEFGVGPGWLREEYEVLDVPFEERGTRMDEFLQIFERARNEGEFSHDGTHYSFQSTGFHPTSSAPSRPRVWVGGKSGATFRRVAEFGDGWTIVRDGPDQIDSARERLLSAWGDYDRQGAPEIALLRAVQIDEDSDRDGPLAGSPEKVRRDVEAYRDAGVTHVGLMFYTLDVDEQIEQLRRFSREVVPELRSG